MTKFTFFSRVAAVLLTAMMTTPLWAWTSEDRNIDLGTHYVGEEVEVSIEGWSEKIFSSSATSQDETVANVYSTFVPEQYGSTMGSICCLAEGSTVIHVTESDYTNEKDINYHFSITVNGNRYVAPCYSDPDCYYNCTYAANPAASLDTVVEAATHIDKYLRTLCYMDLMAMNYDPDNFYRQYSKVPDVSVTSSNPSVAQVDGDYIYFKEAGEATITVSCAAGSDYGTNYMAQSYTYKVTVEAEKQDLNMSTNVYSSSCTGEMGVTSQFLVYVTDNELSSIPNLSLNYTSSNTAVATIANAKWNESFLYYEFYIVPGSEYGDAVITISYAGDDTYKPASTSFTYKLVDSTPAVEKKDIRLSHFEDTEFHTLASDFYSKRDMHGLYEGYLGGYAYIRAVDAETGERINRAIQCRVVSSNESVARIGSNEPSFINVVLANGYGDATITAYFDGDDNFNAAENSISFTIHVTETRFTYVADFRDENGNILTSINMREGDWMVSPTLYIHREGSSGRLHDVEQLWKTDKQRVAWLMKDGEVTEKLYAVAVGDDNIVVTYDLYEDGNETTVKLPVHITSLIEPVSATSSTDITEDIVFNGSEVDTYDGSVINIGTALTEDEVCEALSKKAIGSAEWAASYPGMMAFNLPAGDGTLKVRIKIQSGYRLGWTGRLQDLIQNVSTASGGDDYVIYELQYSTPEVVGIVLFIFEETTPSGAPTRRIVQATQEATPKASISNITVEPHFAIAPNADPDNTGYYYSSFYHDQKYALPNDGTEAYAAIINGDGDLVLTKIAENSDVLPVNTGLILKSTTGSFDLIPSDGASVAFDPSANQLLGVNEATDAPSNTYVLSGRSTDGTVQGVGFYQFTGTLAAHKAYITYNGSSAPKRMRFVFNNEQTATGVDAVDGQKSKAECTKFIEDGQLYIISNGVRYDAQGMIIR